MPEFLRQLFSSDGFMPHGHCYLWNPQLVWLHVISDLLVALAYTSIPFTLVYLARKRRDIPFNWMFLCFGLFIVACGATHVMEIWTLWTPTYWLAGVIKAITAAASVPTALLLIRLIPKALAIPSAQELAKAHEDLRVAHEVLETRVEERTAELSKKNEELLQSKSRFARLLESGIIGIVITDGAGNVREANDTFLSISGYSREDLVAGKIHKTSLAPTAEGAVHQWEKELLRKDGSHVSTLIGVATLEESTKENVAFVLDLTESKRSQAARSASEAQKTAVMEAALDAIVLMDHDGNITDFNAAAERTFGYSRDEVMGRPLADMLIPASMRAEHTSGLQRYLKTGEQAVLGKRIEVTAQAKGGRVFPAEVAVVRIRAEGSPIFTGYIRDITERREAAEAALLRRAKEAAEEANGELEAFSYSVAHDLRAPLRSMSGFSTALLDDYSEKLDADGKGHLTRITAGAQRMGEIIDALLSLARLTRTEARRERVDLSALAHEVLSQLRGAESGREVDFAAADGVVVQGDPQLLRLLLDNLLGNAWKFTSKQPAARITFGLETIEGTETYFVRDNGAGFDMALVSKLFAPFRRLHAAADFAGTGVGLATVQRIVRRHGGRIWATGAEDQGATFRFTLPSSVQSGAGA